MEPSETQVDQIDLLSAVLPDIIAAFRRLDSDSRQRLYQAVGTLFGLGTLEQTVHTSFEQPSSNNGQRFSKERPTSPKEFMLRKQPKTDVERVACLAYYLTNYRETPHFKTLDISKLNTEAAQTKFSNAAKAVDNANMLGYLAPATKANKQLSAAGELFVEALPDRAAAKAAMDSARPRKKPKNAGRSKTTAA
jgi:hypothetical protein